MFQIRTHPSNPVVFLICYFILLVIAQWNTVLLSNYDIFYFHHYFKNSFLYLKDDSTILLRHLFNFLSFDPVSR